MRALLALGNRISLVRASNRTTGPRRLPLRRAVVALPSVDVDTAAIDDELGVVIGIFVDTLLDAAVDDVTASVSVISIGMTTFLFFLE